MFPQQAPYSTHRHSSSSSDSTSISSEHSCYSHDPYQALVLPINTSTNRTDEWSNEMPLANSGTAQDLNEVSWKSTPSSGSQPAMSPNNMTPSTASPAPRNHRLPGRVEQVLVQILRRNDDEIPEALENLPFDPTFVSIAHGFASDPMTVISNCTENRGNLIAPLLSSTRLPAHHRSAILSTLTAHVLHLALDQSGSVALRRILEVVNADELQAFLSVMLPSLHHILLHQFGNYVVQHLLKSSAADTAAQVATAVLNGMLEPSVLIAVGCDRGGSFVLELALRHSTDAQTLAVADVLVHQGVLQPLASSYVGRFVLRAIVQRLKNISGTRSIRSQIMSVSAANRLGSSGEQMKRR